ncbi:MAG: proline dehydrogenase [Bacteroidales bacterium]|nr:proline dehydrogenase [Bacteroidales bacterium]
MTNLETISLPDFNNTKLAFRHRSLKELRRMHIMFSLVGSPFLVKAGERALRLANMMHFPVNWILKPTIFKHFCGGENIEECQSTAKILFNNNVKSILDYSAEGSEKEEDFEATKNHILQTIEAASKNNYSPFAVFKMTGIASFSLLEKLSSGEMLSVKDQSDYVKLKQRLEEIFSTAAMLGIPVMVDAEESWIQGAIDSLVVQMMKKYNREKAIVFNTLQMYRIDRLDWLKNLIREAKSLGFFPGIKFVRGAYWEKEILRAKKSNYQIPVFENKNHTDDAFDNGVVVALENNDLLAVCIATHNEISCMKAVLKMRDLNLTPATSGVYFSQLLGMSDHISFNLASLGYNVAKYVPYGPVKKVIPYLIRRAQENTSVEGQSGRELSLIVKELERRKD